MPKAISFSQLWGVTQEYRAWCSIFVSTFCFSVLPLLFVWGKAEDSPFGFVAVVAAAGAVLGLAICWICAGGRSLAKVQAGLWKSWVSLGLMLGLVVCSFYFVFFSMSLEYVSPAIATMLYETWPVVMMLTIACPGFGAIRLKGIGSIALWIGLTLCIVGVFLLTEGQWGEAVNQQHCPPQCGMADLSASQDSESLNGLWGVIWGALAGITGGLHVAFIRLLVHRVASDMSAFSWKGLAHRYNFFRETFFQMAPFGTTRLLVTPVLVLLAYRCESGLPIGSSIGMAALCGVIMALGGLAMRAAHRLATDNNIIIVYYLTPVFALLWLWLFLPEEFPKVGAALHLDPLLIGAVAIVAGNLIAVFSADRSIAFKGLVLSLWVFGWCVYKYDMPSHKLYYESVVTAVTIFILLVSFRTQRLVGRSERETTDILTLWRQIGRYISPERLFEARKYLRNLIAPEFTSDVVASYRTLQIYLESRGTKGSGNTDEVDAVRARLDIFVYSRQQGTNVGEFMAIGVLGMVAIGGMLLFQPFVTEAHAADEAVLFAKLAAVLVSSSIVFLFCTMIDLERTRRWPRITMDLVTGRLDLPEEDNRRTERNISVGASLTILAVYAYLLFKDSMVCDSIPILGLLC